MNSDPDLSPASLTVAKFLAEESGSAIERAPGLYECRGIGNSYLLTTGEGNVLVNAGTLRDAKRGRESFKTVSQAPLRLIILTQNHANQYGGLEVYASPGIRIIAHRLYPEDRRQHEALAAYYQRGSRRFFRDITGSPSELVPTREIEPDLLIDEHHAFELGGRRFEVIWTPGGEARCAIIVWLPDERVAIVGNLFGPLFGNHPNLNTLRGDKPRSALEFIASAKRVRALGPELLLTGHETLSGRERIQREITRIVDSVQWVHDRTIQGMNEGLDLRTLMREIKPPPELALREEYGKVSWNVRVIWHEYTGWFDPTRGTTELYGFDPSSVAPAIAAMAGGADRLAELAGRLASEGKPLEALHLVDIAAAADPQSASVRQIKREALASLLRQSDGKNLWEQRWIAAQIRELESNRHRAGDTG